MNIKRYLQEESIVLYTEAYTWREPHSHATSHRRLLAGGSADTAHTVPVAATRIQSTHMCEISGISHWYSRAA